MNIRWWSTWRERLQERGHSFLALQYGHLWTTWTFLGGAEASHTSRLLPLLLPNTVDLSHLFLRLLSCHLNSDSTTHCYSNRVFLFVVLIWHLSCKTIHTQSNALHFQMIWWISNCDLLQGQSIVISRLSALRPIFFLGTILEYSNEWDNPSLRHRWCHPRPCMKSELEVRKSALIFISKVLRRWPKSVQVKRSFTAADCLRIS